MTPHFRWHATVTYRSEIGDLTVEHDFEEIEDLQDRLERDPEAYAVKDILIVLNPRNRELFTTLEQDERA